MRPAIVVLAAFLTQAPVPVTLDTVLDRFRAYLSQYEDQYSATLATERYRQTYTSQFYRPPGQPYERRLESDFAIVRPSDRPEWLGFRDVHRVNEKAVTGTGRSLAEMMTNPTAAALDVGWQVARESANYNLGPGFRSINNPAIVFEVLAPRHQARFRFAKDREERIDGMAAWVVRFVEHATPTVVQTLKGNNNPAQGRAWIDPTTGTLIKAEVEVTMNQDGSVDPDRHEYKLTLLVSFAKDAGLDMFVAVRMSERYMVGTHTVVVGEATYSNYRQFSTRSRIVPSP
jgi:hypothetical protein